MTPTVVFLTDFGLADSFLGVMKGALLRVHPPTRILDLNHSIDSFNVRQGAWELMTQFSYFPKGSLFVAVVDPGVGSPRKILLAKTEHYTFLAPDNGILSWVFEKQKPRKVYSVEADRYFLKPVSRTFHGRDVFAPVAGHWANGVPPQKFGPEVQTWKTIPFPNPKEMKNRWVGEVMQIDRFGNLFTNFPNDWIEGEERDQTLLQIRRVRIPKISESYSDRTAGQWVAVPGSHGFLEIALCQGSAAETLNVREGEPVTLSLKP